MSASVLRLDAAKSRKVIAAAMSNRLPVLAAEIRRAHADVQEAAATAAERAIDAGHVLIEAKGLCGHGEWLPWLRENCALAERTAQLYMKIAKSGLESATVADLGIKAAGHAILLKMPDPFDGDPDEARHEWDIFALWGAATGYPAEGAAQYCAWLRRNGWETPSVWLGLNGDKWRSLWRRPAYSEDMKAAWAAFLATNLDRTRGNIRAELQRLSLIHI